MSSLSKFPSAPRSLSLPARAGADLRFVRQTLARAARFTAVPSWSGVAMGAIGLIAAVSASRADSSKHWLEIWLAAATLAFAIGGFELATHFQTEARVQLVRFVLAMAPSFVVGALFTIALVSAGQFGWLAPLWLLTYGAGVVSAGNVSLKLVTWMGVAFLAIGTASLFTPVHWANAWLALGFGGLHAIFGVCIARSNRG